MGTRVITPPPFAPSDCPTCTVPTGSRWAAGENPDRVYIYFSDLFKCFGPHAAPPNGVTFSLPQLVGLPCIWRTAGSNWTVTWEPALSGPARSRVTLLGAGGLGYFVGTGPQCPGEPTVYTNLNTSCAFPVGSINGEAMMTSQLIINQIIEDYNIPTESQLFYEMFIKDVSVPVHKFTNKERSLNVKFEIP